MRFVLKRFVYELFFNQVRGNFVQKAALRLRSAQSQPEDCVQGKMQ
jgi:hypothetical protein